MRSTCVLLAACVAALAVATAPRARTWARVGPASSRDAAGLAPTGDGGLLACGDASGQAGSGLGALLQKLDADGNLEWETLVDGPVDDRFRAVAAMPDGCVAVGSVVDRSSGPNRALAVRFDATGSVVWQRTQSTGQESSWNDVALLADGGVLACGVQQYRNRNFVVSRLDPANGLPDWNLQVADADTGSSTSGECAIVPLPDGTALVAGTTIRQGVPFYQVDSLLLRIAPDGRILEQAAFGVPGRRGSVVDMVLHDDGDLTLLTDGSTREDRNAMLVRLDPEGCVHWSLLLGRPDVADYPVTLARVPGGVVAAVNSVEGTSPFATRLAGIADDGTVLWQHSHADVRRIAKLIAMPAGGLAAGGSLMFVARADDRAGARVDCLLEETRQLDPEPVAVRVIDPGRASELFAVTSIAHDGVVVTPLEQNAACGLLPCAPLRCGGIEATASCDGTQARLLARSIGGEIVSVSWDLDGDTLEDASGNPVVVPLGPGPLSVVATVTDDCPAGAQSASCTAVVDPAPRSAPGEVSNVLAGRPPLLVALDAVRVEDVPLADCYHAYVDAIGAWGAPTAAGGTDCRPPFARLGDGTASIVLTLPIGAWVVVTASNECGEGPAGMTSAGQERSAGPLWIACP